MNAILSKTWSALDGFLVFDVTFSRASRFGDVGLFAVAKVTCAYDPPETRTIDIGHGSPTDFKLRFRSGCKVEGSLQGLSHAAMDGVGFLGVFADMWFCAPRSANIHFEGLMATCPRARLRSPDRDGAAGLGAF